MADDGVLIDMASVFDDAGGRGLDFEADADGERLSFTLRYDALEALAGERPDDRAVALFRAHADAVARMAARALARGQGTDRVVVSENDLDQPG